MRAVNLANIKKTIYYMRRNGLLNTYYAIKERLSEKNKPDYVYAPPSVQELTRQREDVLKGGSKGIYDDIHFSIIVPAYRTPDKYLRELIESVCAQSYPYWELIIADATEDDSVGRQVGMLTGNDNNVRYIKLKDNEGISNNTNHALSYAEGNFVGLLDHDDILTPDALYEMAETIRSAREQGTEPQLIYSDEDKCNEDAAEFYEPHYKEDFNYDLILSNNYICHFMAVNRRLIQELGFRSEYDGAQDYDFVLRAVVRMGIPQNPENEKLILHVNKVLYHWRCHMGSTAENPRSKEFAYEAGKRALSDHMSRCGIVGQAVHLRHLGFYRIKYSGELFLSRPDVGAIGGAVIEHGKITGGRMESEGGVYYEGLSAHYSGYMHRAALTQDAEAVDIRCIALRKELHELFLKVTGVQYKCRDTGAVEGIFDVSLLPENTDYKELSLRLCKAIRDQGYRIMWHRRENG